MIDTNKYVRPGHPKHRRSEPTKLGKQEILEKLQNVNAFHIYPYTNKDVERTATTCTMCEGHGQVIVSQGIYRASMTCSRCLGSGKAPTSIGSL